MTLKELKEKNCCFTFESEIGKRKKGEEPVVVFYK